MPPVGLLAPGMAGSPPGIAPVTGFAGPRQTVVRRLSPGRAAPHRHRLRPLVLAQRQGAESVPCPDAPRPPCGSSAVCTRWPFNRVSPAAPTAPPRTVPDLRPPVSRRACARRSRTVGRLRCP
ncbi:hypothetical protein BJP39_27300 [Streptomyces sp. CC77]|nr:hypothetical protein BJP39_27300 [Streptomyces sp. CC77]